MKVATHKILYVFFWNKYNLFKKMGIMSKKMY